MDFPKATDAPLVLAPNAHDCPAATNDSERKFDFVIDESLTLPDDFFWSNNDVDKGSGSAEVDLADFPGFNAPVAPAPVETLASIDIIETAPAALPAAVPDHPAPIADLAEEYFDPEIFDLFFASEDQATASEAIEEPKPEQSKRQQPQTQQPAVQNSYGDVPEGSDRGLAGAIGLTLQEVMYGKQDTKIEEPKASDGYNPTMVTGRFQSKNGTYIECTLPFPTARTQFPGDNSFRGAATDVIPTGTMPMQGAPNFATGRSSTIVEMPTVLQARQAAKRVTKAKTKKTADTKTTPSPKQKQLANQLQDNLLQQQLFGSYANNQLTVQQQQAANQFQQNMMQPQIPDNHANNQFPVQQQQAANQLQQNTMQPQAPNSPADFQFQNQQQHPVDQLQQNTMQPQAYNNSADVQLQVPQQQTASPQQNHYDVQSNNPQMIPQHLAQHQMQLSLNAQLQQAQAIMMQAQENSKMISAQIAQMGFQNMATQQGHPQQHPGQNQSMMQGMIPGMAQQYQFQNPAFQQTNPQFPVMSHYQTHGLPGPQIPNPFGLFQPMNYSPMPQQQSNIMTGLHGQMNYQSFQAPIPQSPSPAKKPRKSRAKSKDMGQSPTVGPTYDNYAPQEEMYWKKVMPSKLQTYQKAMEQQGPPAAS